MSFFLDHEVPRHLADVLHRRGHEVELVLEVMSPEADDEQVFAYAAKKRAIMLTCNRNDFRRGDRPAEAIRTWPSAAGAQLNKQKSAISRRGLLRL